MLQYILIYLVYYLNIYTLTSYNYELSPFKFNNFGIIVHANCIYITACLNLRKKSIVWNSNEVILEPDKDPPSRWFSNYTCKICLRMAMLSTFKNAPASA